MPSIQSNLQEKASFTVSHMGSLEKWCNYVFEDPKVPTTPGKCFLKERMNLTSMEVSLNILGSGKSIPFYHNHRSNSVR